jgi:hypothetical protein
VSVLTSSFCVVAVDMGLLEVEQIRHALEVQRKEDLDTGSHRPLGQIFADLGYLSEEQVQQVLKQQQAGNLDESAQVAEA